METKTNKEKRKSYGLLAVGAILLIAGILFALYAYNTTYQQSLPIAAELSETKALVKAIKEGTAEGDLDALNSRISSLSPENLHLERPYS